MNGNRYLLDTNAIVHLLKGNDSLLKLLNYAEWVGISVISKLEFLSFKGLKKKDLELFIKFLNKVEVVDLISSDDNLIDLTVRLRKKYNLKLPDAIISSTAFIYKAILISEDKDFNKIKQLKILSDFVIKNRI